MDGRPVAMITGAAQGIGAATATAFAGGGYDLALVDVNRERLASVAEAARRQDVQVLELIGDLADLAFAESIVRRTADELGRLDVLVNNAATTERTTMRTITVEEWERVLRVNLTVPAFLARWAAAQMERAGRGVIVNISSIEAIQPTGIAPAYVAAKGAVDSLTYNLSNLYGPAGIRVVSVRPGAIDTAMSQSYTDADGQSLTDQLRAESYDRTPLGRWGRPEEIAQTILWLAGEGASYITGTHIVVDGGWTRNRCGYRLAKQLYPRETT